MQEIHIMSGLPASGKTTRAQEMVEKQPSLIHLSRDRIRTKTREELNSTEYFPTTQAEEWAGWIGIINQHIENGESVIIDQTTLGEGSLVKLLKAITIPEESTIFVHLFLTSLAACQFRNGFREGFEYVPPDTIQKMHKAAFKVLSSSTVRRLLVQCEKPLVGVTVVTYR